MNLEVLLQRAQEIELAIVNMTSQLTALHGHKTEVAHWIQKLQEPASETKVDEPVASPEEMPVE